MAGASLKGPGKGYLLAVLLPTILLVAVAAFLPAGHNLLRHAVFDTYQRSSPRPRDPDAPVRIVDIDEDSLRRHGQWPWPRNLLAGLTDAIARHDPVALGFDILFTEPDRWSPEALLPLLPEGAARAQLASELAGRPSHDQRFAAALADRRAVLGLALGGTGAVETLPDGKHGFAVAGDLPGRVLPRFQGVTAPLPVLMEAAAGFGAVNWLPDGDQIVREVPLVALAGTRLVPSLALELLRIAEGASGFVLRGAQAGGELAFGRTAGINAVRTGTIEIPTGARGSVHVAFGRSEPGRFIPAWRLLAGDVAREAITGRIVLVGTSAPGLADLRATPLEASVPGVEIHAQVLETVLSGVPLIRPDWASGAELAVAVVAALALALLLPLIGPVGGAAVMAALAGGAMVGGWFAFRQAGVLIDPAPAVVTLAAVFASGTAALQRQALRQRRQVREAFGRFVAPAVVERLSEAPERLVLGGERRDLTLMFCDLRNFTGLAEGLDAGAIALFMNAYLTVLTDEVLAHGGTVDKYIGDAIMAFWNAPLDQPDHAARGAKAALGMVAALARFNTGRAERGEAPVRFGIGLATGACSVGNLGSVRRFDYSAIGDPVNLAARVEQLTKALAVDVLATGETVERVQGFAWLPIGSVQVRGRAEMTSLYGLAGDRAYAGSPVFVEWRVADAALRDALAAGDDATAQRLATALMHRCREGDAAQQRFLAHYAQIAERGSAPATIAPQP